MEIIPINSIPVVSYDISFILELILCILFIEYIIFRFSNHFSRERHMKKMRNELRYLYGKIKQKVILHENVNQIKYDENMMKIHSNFTSIKKRLSEIEK